MKLTRIKPIIVNLTNKEVDYGLAIAEKRNNKPSHTNKAFNGNSLLIHQVGVIGEIAFAKQFGLSIDDTTRPGGDSGYDFVMDGNKIEVKSRDLKSYDFPDLLD